MISIKSGNGRAKGIVANTQIKLDDDELALILEAIQYQRHSAEDKKRELKEFISFCKQTETKIEKLIEET
jgi:hypothetical protein